MSDQVNKNDPYQSKPYLFPRWSNLVPMVLAPALLIGAIGAVAGVWYWFSPKFTDVGYAPVQPVPYSHKLHAGDLGIDCTYCHVGVDKGPIAQVPPTQVCMNCHAQVKADSPKLAPVRQSWETDLPIPWVRIHKVADYAYFDHSRHVNRGVGCVSCHGRIDQMDVVYQDQPLNMAWCMECHRAPEEHLRPLDSVTKMDYAVDDQVAVGMQLKEEYQINPPQDCSGCHR